MRKNTINRLYEESILLESKHVREDNVSRDRWFIANTFELIKYDTNSEGCAYILVNGNDRNHRCNCFIAKLKNGKFISFYKAINYDVNKEIYERLTEISERTFIKNFTYFLNNAKNHINVCKTWDFNLWQTRPTMF